MKYYGSGAVSEFLGDNLVYRNLVPVDNRLPSLEALRGRLKLAPGVTPRKSTPEYARVMVEILKAARELSAPGTQIERVIFIGDTRLNDSTAFRNICQAGGWQGLAFIGAEDVETAHTEIEELDIGALMLANRWSALDTFRDFCGQRGFRIDESTLLLLDLDKTTLGARGRNDQVINQARVEAASQTVSDLLGERYDLQAFQEAYDFFNQTRFHPFTTDNQDYLVYICLLIVYGLFSPHGLKCALDNKVITDFDSFLTQVDRRSVELPLELQNAHKDLRELVRSGDPTPFKAFRKAEFLATAARMGHLPPGTPLAERLSHEILITQEVRALALSWKAQDALLFGLSDKPDEASIPTDELAEQGYLPIHRIVTSLVGSSDTG
jgi:hypothetical protein